MDSATIAVNTVLNKLIADTSDTILFIMPRLALIAVLIWGGIFLGQKFYTWITGRV